MWHLFLRLLAVVAVCLAQAHAQSEPEQQWRAVGDKRSRSRYCGKNLTNMLRLVCNGQYNGINTRKKSQQQEEPILEEPGFWIQPLSAESEPRFPFRTRPRATSFLSGRFRRSSPGVYDECCRKSCSYTELSSYCLNSPTTTTLTTQPQFY